MKVYIQQLDGQFYDDWCFAAFLGANKLGYEIIFFEDAEEVPKNSFMVGDIETTKKYLKKCSMYIHPPLNIPDEISKYAKRKFSATWLNDLIENPKQYAFPIFIKPLAELKVFPSGVLKSPNDLSLIFSDIENKKQLAQISEVISMKSEYRCFVKKKQLVGIQHYMGDFKLFPDVSVIEEMIDGFKSCPASYTLDVAITDKGETVLVECNDAWAVGNYGLDGKLYVQFLLDRWMQMFNFKIKTNE